MFLKHVVEIILQIIIISTDHDIKKKTITAMFVFVPSADFGCFL